MVSQRGSLVERLMPNKPKEVVGPVAMNGQSRCVKWQAYLDKWILGRSQRESKGATWLHQDTGESHSKRLRLEWVKKI